VQLHGGWLHSRLIVVPPWYELSHLIIGVIMAGTTSNLDHATAQGSAERDACYFARSDPDGRPADGPGARWQRLAVHLDGVAGIARRLATLAAPEDARFQQLAWWAGLVHDLGKYSQAFQARLRAASLGLQPQRVEHSAHGAAFLKKAAPEAAFAVAGHHAGLPAPKGSASGLFERTERVMAEAAAFWALASNDFRQQGVPFPSDILAQARVLPTHETELRIRMLGSVLVDGDRLDAGGTALQVRTLHDAGARLDRLLAYVQGRATKTRNEVVRTARQEVLDACLAAASLPSRLFSLTVPTGGGKTLSATAFALRRAALGVARTRRLVYVVPFLTILEQNADVLATAVGSDVVLEHHSGELIAERAAVGEASPLHSGFEEQTWLLRENWNAGVVITTSVRFFETLFSNHPSDLRRLHALAGATVVLDEVQTLPRGMVGPILTMLRNLAEKWSTTFVFCTATQPAFERDQRSAANDPRFRPGEIHEICPPSLQLFPRLQRVQVRWPGGPQLTPQTWEEVAERVVIARQVLCIVNTTRHARELFDRIRALNTGAGLLHLSARMCPLHRLRVLAEVRDALAKDLPCRLVATQVVEAGVDIDFPLVLRAMAPLDSIAQAAGRCDREGLATARAGQPAGEVVVFDIQDERHVSGPPGVYREATAITRRRTQSSAVRIDEPSHVRGYFEELYGAGRVALDAEGIDGLRRSFDFPMVAEKFRIIDDNGRSIVVEYTEEVSRALASVSAAREWLAEHRRTLQRATIAIHHGEFIKVRAEGAVYELFDGANLWVAAAGSYREDVGFVGHIDGPLIA
jgi:CRISPR-associated endonuclease/helicase Cas3